MRGYGSPAARRRLALVFAAATFLAALTAWSEPVRVRHSEGVLHGFLALRTLDGTRLANGDLIQTAQGPRVTSQLTFRFTDGSLHDETAVFSQKGHFRLIGYRLVQKGPSFPRAIDMQINARTGRVTVRHTDADGERKEEVEQLDLPPDLANGVILVLLKNISPTSPPKALSFVAATPKPRLVRLEIASAGEERFSTGTQRRTATHYVVKVEIGGLSGWLAPLLGKQPPDSHVWIVGGEAPAFVKSEQPLYANGPMWRIELVSPVWPPEPKTGARPR